MVVMIPNGEGTDFRGGGLVEVLWKAISGIINRRLSSSIQFHDAMHGFCAGRGIGTATLEANLLQQLYYMPYSLTCASPTMPWTGIDVLIS